MNIPLVNLARQYQSIQEEIDRAIKGVCTKSDFVLGSAVNSFETSFARYIGTTHCVGLASGTDAIKLMLLAAGIKPGDEVITQANTFISTVLPIIELGAKPVLVDCDPMTGAIDVSQVNNAITKRTRVILPVHLYGRPAPMRELKLLTTHYPLLTILEDAAQAHGATTNGKRMGSIGHMAAFSFYPGKNLGAYGDGGAITTNSSKYAKTITILRNIGQRKKYDHTLLGFNSRLDTIQAAVLSVKLKHLDRWNSRRSRIAKTLIDALTGVGDLMLPPPPTPDAVTNWHLFVIQTKKRDRLMKFLAKNDIHAGIHYPVPLHLTPALKFLGYKKGDFPVSENRAKSMISIPMFAELTDPEVAHIIKTVKRFFAHSS
jgi:dTDP-4-amino-4,6-dideoxygalactose transaminase